MLSHSVSGGAVLWVWRYRSMGAPTEGGYSELPPRATFPSRFAIKATSWTQHASEKSNTTTAVLCEATSSKLAGVAPWLQMACHPTHLWVRSSPRQRLAAYLGKD